MKRSDRLKAIQEEHNQRKKVRSNSYKVFPFALKNHKDKSELDYDAIKDEGCKGGRR